MTNINVYFIFHDQEYPVSINNDEFSRLPQAVLHSFWINENKYEILADVSDEVFQSFVNYFSNQTLPNISNENLNEYERLNQEFNIPQIQELINAQINFLNTGLANIAILNDNSISDRSDVEHQISQNLDMYIKNYGAQLINSPIQSLCNILSYQYCNLTEYDLLSEQIFSHYQQTHDSDILILLSLIDESLLKPENFLKSIELQHLNLCYEPRIGTLLSKIQDLEQLNERYKQRWNSASDIIQTDDFEAINNFFENNDIP